MLSSRAFFRVAGGGRLFIFNRLHIDIGAAHAITDRLGSIRGFFAYRHFLDAKQLNGITGAAAHS